MKHNLKISISKSNKNGGIFTTRTKTVRERILKFLLGDPVRVTVLVPGESVDTVAIEEIPEIGDTLVTPDKTGKADPKDQYLKALS